MNQRINYDLEERTALFGMAIVRFSKEIKITEINRPLVNQLIRSATSVGANYAEANGASSRKDFQNKIFICKKEVQETKHWLRILSVCCQDRIVSLRDFWREAQELTMIFQKILNSLRKSSKN